MDLEERVKFLEHQVVLLNNRLFELGCGKDPIGASEYVNEHGEYVDKTVAAKLIGVTRATIYAMLRDGRLTAAYEGKRVCVRSIYRYINKEKKNAED